MRALFLLFALTAAGTLHAAELDAGEHHEGACESRKIDEAHPGESHAVSDPGTPSAGQRNGGSDAIGTRNRMSPRWHSLLPGMFR